MNEPYDVEIEPEVRAWLEAPGDHDFKRVDEVAGMLAEFGPELGGPWADHLEGRCGSCDFVFVMWRLESPIGSLRLGPSCC